MKRLLFLLTLALVSLTTYATGQESDIIYIDGTQWELLGRPANMDSVLYRELKEALPKERSWNTANWDGYTAYWSIQQDKLFLDSIQYMLYEADTKTYRTERLCSDTLLRVFKNYADENGRIVAKWLNRDIRAAKGKVIYYEHMGFERNYETERIISIEQGTVCGVKDYQNYVVDGFSFERSSSNFQNELRQKFPLHIEQYPELAGVSRIVFSIKKARVDAQGHLVDCEVKVLRPDDNPRLAAEIADAMKAYHPWRVLYIKGEYRSYGIEGYTIPYLLEDKR